MCAVTTPVTTVRIPSSSRPALRLVEPPASRGARPARRRPRPAVLRRRRLAALLVLVLAVLACRALLGWSLAGEATAPPGRVAPVSVRTHVVQPGDTLWGIARQAQPEGDVRPLVDRLAASRRGQPLRVGERVVLP